ncbi:glycosyltransferase family 4 protein [Clostridium sardiniense]|uniref:glycosyltransferase family 4 protein n=1 Tax=Clostridium sardiniense TaxID=29369 RepID=UPI001957B2E7|nr:glycosyltransferase family 4 protein [Clostridium sardiniense]MBM7833066.1 glycosyltransferase involved in cell wall biosynthesis [Clostridium sardiniense]
MKTIIYIRDKVNKRSGGPAGYLYNLFDGIKKNNIKNIKLLEDYNSETYINKQNKVKKSLVNIIKHKLPSVYEKKLINQEKNSEEVYIDEDCNFIHFHNVKDIVRYKKENKKNVKLILTSHSPEAPSQEQVNSLRASLKTNYNFTKLKNFLYRNYDIKAFELADYIIFPSEESMDPYKETINGFEKLIKNKNLEFMMSGVEKLQFKLDRETFRNKYNIPNDAFLISYIGRHNKVKGFDILKMITQKLWEKGMNVYVVTGGIGDIEPLKNEKWIDIGWTDDPGSIVNSSDLFILPNRRTYFDLVLLEVLSIGVPVIASNTGGNKTVSKYTDGISLFDLDNIDLVVKEIEGLGSNKEKLDMMKLANLECYYKNFTTEKFAERYNNLLNNLY